MTQAVVSEIWVYPLKSARGFRPAAWELEPSGFRLDRRWMVIDPAGRTVTQFASARMTRIDVACDGDRLVLGAPGISELALPMEEARGERRTAHLEVGESVEVTSVGEEADRWFTAVLGAPCHLVERPSEAGRWVDQSASSGHPLGLQKAVPLHLVAEASLDDLNERLDDPVPMDRFRPNVTVSGIAPHEDDGWKRLRIGDVELRVTRACDHRCGVPNIDQVTGEKSPEPLKTLATYRRSSRGIYFGQNVVVERPGRVRTGDAIEVIETGEGWDSRE